ncbi:uncharacterized protein LOC120840651 [Ixodes scapularis]|uniref:uncharacterized protein LOC120840651 n=1 Tax=Ixodes scapularis TaxID=6945 RepID=UPI001A9E3265|nr:uncharacterized protein LOC120840651 [Ixodes scapularis]
MISFSMAVWWFTKGSGAGAFDIGIPCDYGYPAEVTTACNAKNDYSSSVKSREHTRFGYHDGAGYAMTHDGPEEIKWKICKATRTFPTITFGVAFFDMEFEDTSESCKHSQYGHFTYAAGYWRVHNVATYFKSVVKQPDFIQSGPAC